MQQLPARPLPFFFERGCTRHKFLELPFVVHRFYPPGRLIYGGVFCATGLYFSDVKTFYDDQTDACVVGLGLCDASAHRTHGCLHAYISIHVARPLLHV